MSLDKPVSLEVDKHDNYVKISNLIFGSKRILDLGCGLGRLGRTLRSQTKGVEIVGVDMNGIALEGARPWYDRLMLMDLDSFTDLPYHEGFFDAIILADVLEHLRDPERLLKSIVRYLDPNGVIVVSLPNIARAEIRLKLLFGKFDYTETGILDRTHLHFYTYSTACSLIERSGLKIESVDYTGIASKVGVLPRLFSFQFLITARPKMGHSSAT